MLTLVSSQFDPRAVVHPTGLYNQTQTPLRQIFSSLLKKGLETRVSRERDLELYFKFRIRTS
jgi:hypothetical protein